MDINELIQKEGRRRRFSYNTIETYQNCVKRFLRWTEKSVDKISKKNVKGFLEYLSDKQVAGSTLNVYHMAIKFLFEDILNKNMKLNIKYSKIPKKLPAVLTKEEVKKLIYNIKNSKHKIMISLLYSAGLRASELLNLRIKDLNFKEKYGFVRQGKRRKDRIFIIAKKLERVLIQLSIGRNKEEFLFLNNSGRKYSVSSLQKIIKKAAELGSIQEDIHPHTLRHSFATHLIENGYSVTDVQTLLGHKSPETTIIYLHTAASSIIKIKSPIDEL